MIIVRIRKFDLDMSIKFSEGVFRTTDYSGRNQFNPQKIKEDHCIGKIGEISTWRFLKENGIEGTFPDIRIYTGFDKSHSDDIFVGNEGIKVKSCNTHSPFGISWVFQYNPNPDPIFKGKTDGYVSFCSINLLEMETIIHGFLPVREIVSLMSLPIKDSLKLYKRVIYNEDLEKLNEPISISRWENQTVANPESIS